MSTQLNEGKEKQPKFEGINKILVSTFIFIGFILLSLLLLGGYYFAHYLPKQQSEKYELEIKRLEDENNSLFDAIESLTNEKAELIKELETETNQVLDQTKSVPTTDLDVNLKAKCVSFKIGNSTFTRCK